MKKRRRIQKIYTGVVYIGGGSGMLGSIVNPEHDALRKFIQKHGAYIVTASTKLGGTIDHYNIFGNCPENQHGMYLPDSIFGHSILKDPVVQKFVHGNTVPTRLSQVQKLNECIGKYVATGLKQMPKSGILYETGVTEVHKMPNNTYLVKAINRTAKAKREIELYADHVVFAQGGKSRRLPMDHPYVVDGDFIMTKKGRDAIMLYIAKHPKAKVAVIGNFNTAWAFITSLYFKKLFDGNKPVPNHLLQARAKDLLQYAGNQNLIPHITIFYRGDKSPRVGFYSEEEADFHEYTGYREKDYERNRINTFGSLDHIYGRMAIAGVNGYIPKLTFKKLNRKEDFRKRKDVQESDIIVLAIGYQTLVIPIYDIDGVQIGPVLDVYNQALVTDDGKAIGQRRGKKEFVIPNIYMNGLAGSKADPKRSLVRMIGVSFSRFIGALIVKDIVKHT